MLSAILTVLVLCLLGALVTSVVHFTLKTVEETDVRFDMHPTLNPQTVEITDENVRDVIDMTIEDGFDHPALAARKVQG